MSFIRMTYLAFAAVFAAGGARAVIITGNTNGAESGFVSPGVALPAPFLPDSNRRAGVPFSILFNNFGLVCDTCTAASIGSGSFFTVSPFALVVTAVPGALNASSDSSISDILSTSVFTGAAATDSSAIPGPFIWTER